MRPGGRHEKAQSVTMMFFMDEFPTERKLSLLWEDLG